MMNNGASAMRGMPLSAKMNGSSILPRKSNRASSAPVKIPASVPTV
jgi:hypothetical protein